MFLIYIIIIGILIFLYLFPILLGSKLGNRSYQRGRLNKDDLEKNKE